MAVNAALCITPLHKTEPSTSNLRKTPSSEQVNTAGSAKTAVGVLLGVISRVAAGVKVGVMVGVTVIVGVGVGIDIST
jgi:hypothetical protein